MTLHLIGTGLGHIDSISVRAKEVLMGCSDVYLEHYTAVLSDSVEDIAGFLDKDVIVADRDFIEKEADELLEKAKDSDVGLLIVGDVFAATTHTDLFLRAKSAGIEVKCYFNGSILTAVGLTGLELYKFGKTTSMVFFDDWRPATAYDVVESNGDLHTLILCDIKVAEPTKESLLTGKSDVQDARFMSVNECLEQLLSLEQEHGRGVVSEDTLVVGCARLGQDDFMIKAGSIKELLSVDFGAPMHCVIVPGKLHFVEEEALAKW